MEEDPSGSQAPMRSATPEDEGYGDNIVERWSSPYTPLWMWDDPEALRINQRMRVRPPTAAEKEAWKVAGDTPKKLIDRTIVIPPTPEPSRSPAAVRPTSPSEQRAQSIARRERPSLLAVRGTFGRQTNKPNGNGNMNQQKGPGSGAPSPTIPYGPSLPPAMPALNTSGSFAPSADASSPQVENQSFNHNQAEPMEKEKPKYFFNPKFAKLGVKGNFMPLAAQPKNVDIAEWLAHHCMEQYRLVAALLAIIQEVDTNTGMAICNPKACPVMSAGRSHTYTWLNNEKVPIKVPATQYIQLVQRWIGGKVNDPKAFPTDNITSSSSAYGGLENFASAPIGAAPTTSSASLSQLAGRNWLGKSAGFPESFYSDVKTCFRQMFRLYAHLYHSHWVDPFWHLSSGSTTGGYTDLNSCFVHFITVAKLFALISEKDAEPMQPLIDIWIQNGSIPVDAVKGACAISPNQ